jgi:proteasome lid subunit RPN8/RPN11
MSTVTIPRKIATQLLTHAQHNPEVEVCGLISGRDGHAVRVYPVSNISEEPDHLFDMDPKAEIDSMRTMRERGEALFGIYHSHPHSPPEPSAEDLDKAGYPDALYLIISLDTKGVLQLRGYHLGEDKTIEPVDLVVEEVA